MSFMKKSDLDRHVEDCMRKINNETERNLRCYSFAKQYFQIDRFEEARQYVSTYLGVRPDSPEAHLLLGKCLEKLGRKDAAIQAYTTSLRLDPKQNKLLFKVCELLITDNVDLSQGSVKHFCELAQSVDPHHPTIFNLKQRILTLENDDPTVVSNLILKELETRPTDVNLRIKLVKHLAQNHMIQEAYKHVSEIEFKDLAVFQNNLQWYEAMAQVLVKYQRSVATLDWEFWFLSVATLDRLAVLSLEQNNDCVKSSSDYINAVFNFDQTLAKASQNIPDCPDKNLAQEFLKHYSAQLCLHLATLVFKQAQKDFIKYKEAANVTLPLFFAAYHSTPPDLQSLWFNHASESRRSLVRRWRKEGAFRCSQSGHVLQAAAKDRKAIVLEKAEQFSKGMWREQLFKKLFITRQQQANMTTSFFLTDVKLLEITLRLPEAQDLIKYDEESQWNYPDGLHYHIWIALNNKLSDFQCTVFDGLQYSIKNLRNCGAETLNLLDIQAFIYCATLCAKFNIDNTRLISYYNVDKPNVLPAVVTPDLATINQNTFFKTAYKMFKNEHDPDLDQLRLTLIEGLKILRCVDNGLDVKLLVVLAKTFSERAKNLVKQSEIDLNEARAELYWKAALPILEKLRNGQAVSYPPNKLFNYRSNDLPIGEICSDIETGKLFSGMQLMKKKEYEKSLRVLETLKDPYASFYQAQIYKLMADQQTSLNRESVTSEMRSQNIILLSRARDCLYLTLDRLREPSMDQKHPLNEQLGTEIEKIERLLSRIDPDCVNRNECDGMSDENVSDADSEHYVTGLSLHNSTRFHQHSTPYRDIFKREAKPSPERLDAQLRQLAASKDAAIGHILEHNKIMLDSHRNLVEELRSFKEAVNHLAANVEDLKSMKASYEDLKDIKKSVTELKASIDELDSFKNVSDMVYEMKKELSELRKEMNKTSQLSEEDIYGLANDYTAEYNLNTTNLTYNPNLYQNYQRAASLYPPVYPGMYPMYGYPGLGLPQTFPDPALQPQDFRTVQQPQILPQTSLFKDPKATKQPPVNVVITSSDPLPSSKPVSQPVLSVTIPAQHLKGTTKPHNYQIPLPSAAMATSAPSVLSKPAPAVSTQSILSTVSAPVYSAVVDTLDVSAKSDKENDSTLSEEHDPCPDFKPIIPLPDEVPVNTGEENETVLFCERAKLFRYVSDGKEWRERGVGLLKILKNKETNKIRILMRREQVLKICANHFLTKDMTLTPMPKSDRAYIWAAQDFADEEIVLEKLCVRFKTAEEAKRFFDAFEDAKKQLESKSLGGFVFSTTPAFKPNQPAVIPTEAAPQQASSPFANFTFQKESTFTPVKNDEDDFVPTAEFKPVVPLPDLVEVKTGEENSEVLFEAKAKLLRFDPNSDPKWKEKGVGVIKLLKENILRLVMRRDQVLKVCCNHQVLKNMEFKPMTTNPKALTWCAKDFSDGELKLETFAIRFKTEELASDFLRVLKEAQDSLDDNHNYPTGKHQKTDKVVVGFGDKFKPVKGSWTCKNCLVVNEGKCNYCIACETPKNDALPPKKSDDASSGAAFSFGVSGNSWGNAFKPKEGSWECTGCYVRNDKDKTSCVACGNGSSSIEKEPVTSKFSFGVPATGFGDKFKPKEGSWECKSCLVRNNTDVLHCVACNTPKDDTVKSTVATTTTTTKYTFGFPVGTTANSTTATFTFGQSTIQTSPFVFKPTAAATTEEAGDKFVFGSPQKHDFEFTPRSPRRISSGGGRDEESDTSYVEEEADNIYFKPVIPLPDKVDVKTGEEHEDVLYCHRAKLYRFTGGEWKERGLGDLKILKSKDTGKLRVLMRREQVLKICLNHILTADIKYKAKDEKTWLFSAPDFSEGEIANEHFCVRFKNAEIAQDFIKAVNDALSGALEADEKSEASVVEEEGEVEFISESQVTAEEEKEAIRLGLPPKFFAYRQLPDCTCEQCKKDDVYLKDLFKGPTTTSNSSASSMDSFVTGKSGDFTLKSLLSNPSLLVTPASKDQSQFFSPQVTSPSTVLSPPTTSTSSNLFSDSAKASPFSKSGVFGSGTTVFGSGNIFGSKSTSFVFGSNTTPSTPKETVSSPTVFGGTNSLFKTGGSLFGSTPTTTTTSGIFGATPSIFATTATSIFASATPTTTTSIFGGTTSVFGQSVFGKETNASKLSFGAETPVKSELNLPTKEAKTINLKEDDAVVLDDKSGVSFAALAAKVGSDATPAFAKKADSTTPFAFLGAGAPVFGSADKNKSVNKSTSEDGQEGGGDEDYDPHYEPIIPLPEAIVVTTGEEDEEVMFNERAKLFRYDADNKEWKERGVGQMKILYHPINNTYRFLLRREQVHKVVLNQLIRADLELQPMTSSDKAWVWAGYNYTDDESALEKLAIRFKNTELAQSFLKVVKEVIEKVKTADKEAELIPASIENFEQASEAKQYAEEEEEEDEEEDDDDDDEDDRTIMFMKRCTLSEQIGDEWKVVTLGDLQVYYDPDLYAARICVNDDSGKVVSNTLIGINTVMNIDKNTCMWRAVEWAGGDMRQRTLKATFSSTAAAQEFHSNYLEGLNYAQEFDVVDEVPETLDEEETEEVEN